MPTIANPSASSFCDYDAWNRLVALRGNTVTIAEFTYDGLHRRIFKSNLLNEMIDYYYSDQWQDLEERWTVDDVTQTNRQCIWGLRYIDDLVLRDRDTNGDGTLNQRIYALQDANFNVVAQVQGTSVAKRQAYEAYGQPIFLTPTFTAGSSTLLAWEYHFAGYYWDRESQLYPVRHRYLHTRLGRWLTRDPWRSEQTDPIAEAVSANLYEYAGSNPTGYVDPMGEDFIAVADRPVRIRGNVLFYHYSLQYWTCGRIPLFNQMDISSYERNNPEANLEDSFELIAEYDWHIYGYIYESRQRNPSPQRTTFNIPIARIQYEDTSIRMMGIYQADPQFVRDAWEQMVAIARVYPYAEQPPSTATTTRNWPRSLYSALGTNSNTFVRYVVRQSGHFMAELSGFHPGHYSPRQNALTFRYGSNRPWR